MSRRREVQDRLATLDEIDGIMVAMKNLALLEARKIETFLATQRKAVASIEAAAQDFLGFYPETAEHASDIQQLLLVIGSERGFCGDYNETLLKPIDLALQSVGTQLVAVGRRLQAKLQDDRRIAAYVAGPSVVEEVSATLVRLAGVLGELQQQRPAEAWCISVLYHDDESGGPRQRQLLPLMPELKRRYACPPLLNLAPTKFLALLTSQYLYAVLHEVFYASMMAENRKRLEHMDGSIRRLEKDEARLRMRCNALRQEEIIEEIEIIMLSVDALSDDESEAAEQG